MRWDFSGASCRNLPQVPSVTHQLPTSAFILQPHAQASANNLFCCLAFPVSPQFPNISKNRRHWRLNNEIIPYIRGNARAFPTFWFLAVSVELRAAAESLGSAT